MITQFNVKGIIGTTYSLYRISKFSLLLGFTMACAGCGNTILIDPELSPVLRPIQEEYKLIYKNDDLSADNIEFISGQNELAILIPGESIILHIPDKRIIKKFARSAMYAQASQINNRFLYAMSNRTAQIWDTKNWKLLREFKGKMSSGTNGLSPDGSILYMGGAFISVDSGVKLISFGLDPTADSHDFSADGRYFIEAGPYSGTMLVDIPAKKIIPRKTIIRHVSQLRFRRDNDFYASYDAIFTLKIAGGGYFPRTLGLFSHASNEIIRGVIPTARIACWTTTPDDKILMALVNGELVLLNRQLAPLDKWFLGDKVNVCQSGQNSQVWLGTKTKGIYKIDLTHKTLSNPVKTSGSIRALDVSPDEKYLALVEGIPGGSRVKVYQIPSSN